MKFKCKCGNVMELMMWGAWEWTTITSENIESKDIVEKQDSAYAKCDKCKTITHIYLKANYRVSGSFYEEEKK